MERQRARARRCIPWRSNSGLLLWVEWRCSGGSAHGGGGLRDPDASTGWTRLDLAAIPLGAHGGELRKCISSSGLLLLSCFPVPQPEGDPQEKNEKASQRGRGSQPASQHSRSLARSHTRLLIFYSVPPEIPYAARRDPCRKK